DSMDGGLASDTFIIEDGFGNDTIIGGEGAGHGDDVDTIDLSALTSAVTVTFTGPEAGTITDGTNTITFSEIEKLILTEQADVVDATSDTSGIEIVAGNGNDTVDGGSGEDTIDGGAGDDVIDGWGGNDVLTGGAGNDYLFGDTGDDTLSGGTGNDTLLGTWGNDSMSGGDDADTFMVSSVAGIDTIDGGEGGLDADTLMVDDNVDLTMTFSGDDAGTYAYAGGGASGSFINIEAIQSGAGNDTIDASASSASVTVQSGAGDDSIIGSSADDLLDGGDGSDVFQIGALEGNDVVLGGLGSGWTDSIQLEGMGSSISINGDTIDGDGWTIVLDSGSAIDSQSGNELFLSDDAAGVITFDAGGEVDFAGIETVSW
ncbi:MAG: calcium-binding protein, partial [Pseudomonadota bacterium]